MTVSVQKVDFVSATIEKTFPPTLVVQADGTVSTSGWSSAALVPAVYVVQPVDGIQDFDFLADEPTGNALQVLEPISASASLPQALWIKGVRVRAKSNTVERLLGLD